MTEDIVDAEIIREHRLDWCNAGQHTTCPAVVPATLWPDPARKGAFYTIPETRCSCICHKRPVLSGTESKPNRKR